MCFKIHFSLPSKVYSHIQNILLIFLYTVKYIIHSLNLYCALKCIYFNNLMYFLRHSIKNRKQNLCKCSLFAMIFICIHFSYSVYYQTNNNEKNLNWSDSTWTFWKLYRIFCSQKPGNPKVTGKTITLITL